MPLQAFIHGSLESIDIIETPIPVPKDNEIVIKVVVSGTNPKDWKYPLWKAWPHNSGDDIAGIVHAVGKAVYEFKPGDRVAALHEPTTPNGSFAEYAVAPEWTTFHLSPKVSFEEAATVPTAAFTAALALYTDLKLSLPYLPGQNAVRTPVLIYGVTSAVGAFAAKFARLSGLGPLIGVAGRSRAFASTLVDYVVDYRNGEDTIVAKVESILAKEGHGPKVSYVFDAISEGGSLETTLRLLDPAGSVATVLPPALFAKDKSAFKFPPGVEAFNTACPRVFWDAKDFGHVWARFMGRLLGDGRLTAHPFEVIPGGLDGVLPGLQKLRDGKASAVKYVYRIEESKGVPTSSNTLADYPLEPDLSKSTHPLRNFPFPLE